MSYPEWLLLTFVVIQTGFIMLDLAALRRQHDITSLRSLLVERRGTVAFLAGLWLVYLFLEFALFSFFPDLERTFTAVAGAFGISFQASDAPPRPVPPVVIIYLLASVWLVAGFWDYAIHRWVLHSRFFWFLHENHHLPTQVFNGMLGITLRPFQAPTAFLLSAGTAIVLAGWIRQFHDTATLWAVLTDLPILLLIYSAVGSASHSLFLRQRSWPSVQRSLYLVVTPQEHILHHGVGLKGNYGNFMTLWDHVFGTYLSPAMIDPREIQLGLDYDQDFVGTLTASKIKIPQTLRDRHGLGAFSMLSPAKGDQS